MILEMHSKKMSHEWCCYYAHQIWLQCFRFVNKKIVDFFFILTTGLYQTVKIKMKHILFLNLALTMTNLDIFRTNKHKVFFILQKKE